MITVTLTLDTSMDFYRQSVVKMLEGATEMIDVAAIITSTNSEGD